MIPKEIIEKAIEGGWKGGIGATEDWAKINHIAWRAQVVCDPLFWQSLGKSLGWEEKDKETLKLYHKTGIAGDMPKSMYTWHKRATKFYHLLLTNGDTDKFWKDLLANK